MLITLTHFVDSWRSLASPIAVYHSHNAWHIVRKDGIANVGKVLPYASNPNEYKSVVELPDNAVEYVTWYFGPTISSSYMGIWGFDATMQLVKTRWCWFDDYDFISDHYLKRNILPVYDYLTST